MFGTRGALGLGYARKRLLFFRFQTLKQLHLARRVLRSSQPPVHLRQRIVILAAFGIQLDRRLQLPDRLTVPVVAQGQFAQLIVRFGQRGIESECSTEELDGVRFNNCLAD